MGEGFALWFGEGGHHKRLISYSPTLIFSLLHDLDVFFLDLDLDPIQIRNQINFFLSLQILAEAGTQQVTASIKPY